MLKTRIIPTLLYSSYGLVKGVSFDNWRHIGSPMQAIKVYNLRQVDELIFLDIMATCEGRSPEFDLIDDLADECFMPLAVGGGVRSIDDARHLLSVGADKIAVNSAAVCNPNLIREIASKFGSQCVVVSLDVRKASGGRYEIFIHSGTKATGMDPIEFVKKAEKLGAGEILLTSIECDGTMRGYDIDLIKAVSSVVSIPVIASGGAGSYDHMASAIIDGAASAVAAASIFHFTQCTPLEAKDFLHKQGIDVRL